MPRIIGEEQHVLKLHDNLSDSEIVLYYRSPTTSERNGYENEAIRRKRNRVVMKRAEARLKYGGIILTGFRSGDFAKKVNGKIVPIASDENDPNFDSEWKKIVMESAGDIVMLLAVHVFDLSAEIDDDEEAALEDGEDVDRD